MFHFIPDRTVVVAEGRVILHNTAYVLSGACSIAIKRDWWALAEVYALMSALLVYACILLCSYSRVLLAWISDQTAAGVHDSVWMNRFPSFFQGSSATVYRCGWQTCNFPVSDTSVIFVTKIKTRTRIIGRRFQRTRTRIIVIQKTKTK